MSKKTKTDLGPLDFMIDLAGAAVMKSVVKNKIIKDYKRGQGKESVTAATAVFAHQAMRSGSDGMVGLGGLYGVTGALKEIERKEAAEDAARSARVHSEPVYASPALSAPVNDNREAWRLNTEEAKRYGLDPNDFATREAYLSALNEIKAFQAEIAGSTAPAIAPDATPRKLGEVHTFCKVSLLTNGKNKYFLADGVDVSVGCAVTVQNGESIAKAIVLTVEQHSAATAPSSPEETEKVLEAE